jgi:translation initiation factor IF-1
MATVNSVELDGVVTEALPNTMFRVTLQVPTQSGEPREALLLATLSGKMRTRHIRVLPGDKVKVVVVPPDLSKGRIVYRYR